MTAKTAVPRERRNGARRSCAACTRLSSPIEIIAYLGGSQRTIIHDYSNIPGEPIVEKPLRFRTRVVVQVKSFADMQLARFPAEIGGLYLRISGTTNLR